MLKAVILVGVVSLALGGNVRERRQLKQYYKPVQPTFAPTYAPSTYAPPVYAPGALFRILRLDSDISPEGNYRYAYDTENGISAQETGEVRGAAETAGIVAQGTYQYVSPEGIPIQVQYLADENGYQPSGVIIPGSGTRTGLR